MKTIFKYLGKSVFFAVYAVYWVFKQIFSLFWFLLKGAARLALGLPQKGKRTLPVSEPDPLEMVFQDPPRPKNAVTKMGSVLPVEEDHDLRNFTLLNAEGEIYQIDTALPGPFYGPVWTRILSCHENRETLRGRLVRPVFAQSGKVSGYQVRIGNVKAFLPASQAMKFHAENPINLRLSVVQVDPTTRNVTVSARQAYQSLFAKKPAPRVGEETEALYWDYSEEAIFLLLPGEYVAQAQCHEKAHEIAARMGNLTRCHVESVQEDSQIALVTLLDSHGPAQKTPPQPDEFEEEEAEPVSIEEGDFQVP